MQVIDCHVMVLPEIKYFISWKGLLTTLCFNDFLSKTSAISFVDVHVLITIPCLLLCGEL